MHPKWVAELLVKQVLDGAPAELQRVVLTLAKLGGRFGTADRVARAGGFADRFVMARWLSHHHLPCMSELAGRIEMLCWVLEWESRGRALAPQALSEERMPSVYYRKVRDLAGVPWTKLRERGSTWVLQDLRKRVAHVCMRRVERREEHGQA